MRDKNTRTGELCTATKLRRFGNYLIDMIIFRMLLFPVVFFIAYTAAVFGLAGPEFWESIDSPIADWLLTISIFFLYYFAFEVIWQRTPGKFITGTKVVTPDGRKPATYAIAVRTLARLVPFEPFSFLGKEAYGWHDKWSCTTIVRAKRIEQNLTEASLTTNQDEQSLGITALLEKEYGNERPEKETVAQAKAVTQNSEEEKQGVVAEQIGTVKVACREEEICDAVTHGQSTETDKEQVKWLALALLVFILIAIIVVRFSNTPAATRGDSNPIYGQQRDLSTPSSRLVGHWVGVLPYGGELYYSPIDRSLDVGTYWWTPVSKLRSAVKFKILSESRWGKQLTTREFIPLDDTILCATVEYCIPKNGQSMTQEILFEDGDRLYTFVYRYVDSKTVPPFKDF